jgi:DHA1 family multidrug resistance protein-like MFS transporter
MTEPSPSVPGMNTGQGESRRKLLIAIILVVVFLYWSGLYLYMPTLPVYVQGKVENLAVVGTILSMYGLWQMIVRLPIGIAADWLGRRKPFILVGLVLVALGAWVLGHSDSTGGLFLGRAITGLAAGTWVPLVVVFSGLFRPEEAIRATALLTMVSSLSKIVATGLTGWINTASGGYLLAFELAALVAGVGLVVMLFFPEKRQPKTEMNLGKLGRLIGRRDVLLPALLNAVIQYGDWAATFSFIPIVVKRMGASGVVQSSMLSMNTGIVLVGNLLAASLVKRFGQQRLALACFSGLALGITGVALAPSLPWVFLSQGCIGLSVGAGYPLLMGMSISKVNGSERTIAMGLHQAVYAIGMFAGPWLSGIIANGLGIAPMFGITGFAILVIGYLGIKEIR